MSWEKEAIFPLSRKIRKVSGRKKGQRGVLGTSWRKSEKRYEREKLGYIQYAVGGRLRKPGNVKGQYGVTFGRNSGWEEKEKTRQVRHKLVSL